MTLKHSITLSLFALLAGCAFTFDDGWSTWDWNWAPVVYDGDAGCEWSPRHGDYWWYFEAEVSDWDGLGDIRYVEANVYDDHRGGYLVDSFALDPTFDDWVWYGEWPERATALDCFYSGYSVDLVAWDSYDDYGVLTVYPSTP